MRKFLASVWLRLMNPEGPSMNGIVKVKIDDRHTLISRVRHPHALPNIAMHAINETPAKKKKNKIS